MRSWNRLGPSQKLFGNIWNCFLTQNDSTSWVVELLRTVLGMASSWQGVTAIVTSTDVWHAFDEVQHSVLAQALERDDQLDPVLAAALFREATGQSAVGTMVGERTDEFDLEKGSVQGRPESPSNFTRVLQMLLTPLVRNWRSRGLGFPYQTPSGEQLATLVVWADNMFVLSADWAQLSMWRARLRLKPGETKVLASRGLPTLEEKFGCAVLSWAGPIDGEHLDITGVSSLTALGTELDRDGSSRVSLNFRLGQADACFYKHKTFLRNARNHRGTVCKPFTAVVE